MKSKNLLHNHFHSKNIHIPFKYFFIQILNYFKRIEKKL
jgi:hypothetical protein